MPQMSENQPKHPHHGTFLLLITREMILGLLALSAICATVYFSKRNDLLEAKIRVIQEENKQQTEAINALVVIFMSGDPSKKLNGNSQPRHSDNAHTLDI